MTPPEDGTRYAETYVGAKQSLKGNVVHLLDLNKINYLSKCTIYI
jgi:hypothetical protein